MHSRTLMHELLKADAHMAICGAAAVPFGPGAPGRAGAQCTRDDHYPVCRLDIRQDSEFAAG